MTQPDDPIRLDNHLAKKASHFVLIEIDLYKLGYSLPLLKCVCKEQAKYIINEIHHGVCDFHSGHHTMATRILRAGYY